MKRSHPNPNGGKLSQKEIERKHKTIEMAGHFTLISSPENVNEELIDDASETSNFLVNLVELLRRARFTSVYRVESATENWKRVRGGLDKDMRNGLSQGYDVLLIHKYPNSDGGTTTEAKIIRGGAEFTELVLPNNSNPVFDTLFEEAVYVDGWLNGEYVLIHFSRNDINDSVTVLN